MRLDPGDSVFGFQAAPALLQEVVTHAERAYPDVACGIVLGPKGQRRLSRVRPIARLSKSPEHSFVSPSTHARLSSEAAAAGLEPRILYHSHCDLGAGMSPLDRVQAMGGGGGWPGLMQLVVSVRGGRFEEMAGYAYDPVRAGFLEQRYGVGAELERIASRSVPDDGRLVPPVGGALRVCQVADNERSKLTALTEGRKLVLRQRHQLQDLDRLARGFYSPVRGYLREVELRALRAVGRLPEGTPWRHPLVLEVPEADAEAAQPAAIVELCGPDGAGRAVLAVSERRPLGEGRVGLAGPVFAYPVADGQDAVGVRAALLQRGARRVLAVPAHLEPMAIRAGLSDFDVVLATGRITGALDIFSQVGGGAGWIQAAMAQNLGATHICLPDDASLRRVVRDTLQIQAWPPFGPG